MAPHREGFYCVYFSQRESGQSTLCEHLIGLTAGEEVEERKQRHGRKKSASHQDFKFVGSDVDKCISSRLILDIVHQNDLQACHLPSAFVTIQVVGR